MPLVFQHAYLCIHAVLVCIMLVMQSGAPVFASSLRVTGDSSSLPAACQAKLDTWCNTAASTGEGCAAERTKAKCLVDGKPQQFVARRSTSGWGGTAIEWRCRRVELEQVDELVRE